LFTGKEPVFTMLLKIRFVCALLLLVAGSAQAASSWSFDDGRISVVSKKDAEGTPDK
jgi:oligosaccharyltransferase complex subunit delta (ribophorin II)